MIPAHLVQEVRYIELRTQKRVRSLRVGGSASPLRGDGFDFDQHRPYRPGDDTRRIDWNATARTGMPFLRQTKADRELQVVLALDLTRSMQFGSGPRSKHDALVLASSALLFTALEDRLATGIIGFTDRTIDSSAPVSDRASAWAALQKVWGQRVHASPTLIRPVIQHLLQTLKRTTLVVLLSDFQTDEPLADMAELSMLAARHDVVAVVLEDRAETALPAGRGFVRMRDLESDAEVMVGLNAVTRRLFAARLEERRLALRNLFYRTGVSHVVVDVQGDPLEPIMGLFNGRRR